MSLENLAKIGKLKQHSATREDAAKLLATARRNLAETRIKGLSPETRFDLAYKAVMQCGLLAIMGNGYRPSTNEPGHHATVIQTLPITIGLENDRMILLDALRAACVAITHPLCAPCRHHLMRCMVPSGML